MSPAGIICPCSTINVRRRRRLGAYDALPNSRNKITVRHLFTMPYGTRKKITGEPSCLTSGLAVSRIAVAVGRRFLHRVANPLIVAADEIRRDLTILRGDIILLTRIIGQVVQRQGIVTDIA